MLSRQEKWSEVQPITSTDPVGEKLRHIEHVRVLNETLKFTRRASQHEQAVKRWKELSQRTWNDER